MFKSISRNSLIVLQKLIVQCWIDPLDKRLWEMVGLDQSSPWFNVRMALAWLRDIGRLIYSGFRVNIRRWDGPEWSIVYINEDTTNSEQELQHLFFGKTPAQTELGRAFLWQLPSKIRQFTAQNYLVICDINRLIRFQFQGVYSIRIFPWLRGLLDISISINSLLGGMTKSRRRDISNLEKREPSFKYKISHNPDDFELFYNKMYLPFIFHRYQERTILFSYSGQKELFKDRGKLICTYCNGNLVAASLGTIRRYGNTYSTLHMGIHQEHTELLSRGLNIARYWHMINWAQNQNLDVIDFGGTRARLYDGVFLFKHRWGMRFERDIMKSTMWTFFGQDLPPSLIRRLNDLGFIVEVNQEYRCLVFDHPEAGLSDNEIAQREKIINQASLDGLLQLPVPT